MIISVQILIILRLKLIKFYKFTIKSAHNTYFRNELDIVFVLIMNVKQVKLKIVQFLQIFQI